MQQDVLLIRKAQGGDPDAFEALVAPYERRVYSVCLRMVSSREDALDCAQETMLRAWKAMPGYRKQASLSTWLLRIATNICLDLLRKRKNSPALSLDALSEEGFSPAADTHDPQRHLEDVARQEALSRGIASLPADMRAVLVLRDIQSLPYAEISDILDIPEGTVKSRVNRAREKLRAFLFHSAELFSPSAVYASEGRNEP